MKIKFFAASMAILLATTLGSVLLTPAIARAATAEACGKSSSSFLGFPTWYRYLNPTFDDSNNECKINFDPQTDIPKVVLAVFEIILRLAGIIAVIFVIYGGFQYILSQAEPDRVKGARSTIINALIGLAIAISATFIVNLIARNIT